MFAIIRMGCSFNFKTWSFALQKAVFCIAKDRVLRREKPCVVIGLSTGGAAAAFRRHAVSVCENTHFLAIPQTFAAIIGVRMLFSLLLRRVHEEVGRLVSAHVYNNFLEHYARVVGLYGKLVHAVRPIAYG